MFLCDLMHQLLMDYVCTMDGLLTCDPLNVRYMCSKVYPDPRLISTTTAPDARTATRHTAPAHRGFF